MWSFRLVLGDKTGKEIPKSSRLEFLEKFLASNFALLDAEDNTGRSLNRVDIANLTFLRKLWTVQWKSQDSSFLEVMDSFVLLSYASLQLQEHFCIDY